MTGLRPVLGADTLGVNVPILVRGTLRPLTSPSDIVTNILSIISLITLSGRGPSFNASLTAFTRFGFSRFTLGFFTGLGAGTFFDIF